MEKNIHYLLSKLDSSNEPRCEHDIYKLLSKATSEPEEEFIAKSEQMAFLFDENSAMNYWGTYFCPHRVDFKEKLETPSLSLVTKEMLDYWKKRAETTKNALMKARYYGLIYDFQKHVTGKKVNYKIADKYVSSLLKTCQDGLCSDFSGETQKIERAYRISKSFNKNEWVENCIETAINIEDRIIKHGRFDQIGRCFNLFIGEKEKFLTEEQRNRIILNLEKTVEQLSVCGDPRRTEEKGRLLAGYYRSSNKKEEIARVLNVIANCGFVACEKNNPMTKSLIYHDLRNLYNDFNMNDEFNDIIRKIANIGEEIIKSMGKYPVPSVMAEDLNFDLQGGIEDVLRRISEEFITGEKEAEKLHDENTGDNVFALLAQLGVITTTCYNDKGIPSVSNEKYNHAIKLACQIILSKSHALYSILLKVIEKYNIDAEEIVAIFYKSIAFKDQKREIIKRGIHAFIEKDFLVAIHLLVPQIESVIHNLVKLNGGDIYEENRFGGLQLKFFERLLSDNGVSKCFNEDTISYFKIMLTDQRGFNIRNDVCHGIMPQERFDWLCAVRIIHILLCLSQAKALQDSPDSGE
jgi:hypothetical protein